MFHRERVIAALEAKADRFTGYEQALAALAGLSRVDIEAWLAGGGWPGGRPTARGGEKC